MSKRTRLWPFSLVPYYWGIDQDTKSVEYINYYWEGEDRDRKLLDLKFSKDSKEWKEHSNQLDKKYKKIDQEEYDKNEIDLKFDDHSSVGYKLACLDHRKRYEVLSENEYEKEKATIKGEPYVRVLYGEFVQDKDNDGVNGQMTFELDWNDIFVEELREDNWEGISDDQVVNNWFEDVCRQMSTDEFDEDGHNFVSNGPRVRKKNLGDNKAAVG